MTVNTILHRSRLFERMALCVIFVMVFFVICATESFCSDYHQLTGLIDLRSTFSDGANDVESLVRLAKKKGFSVLIINDHDRMVMEYGILPFRNLIKRRVELPSINENGAKAYLGSIRDVQKKYPDMIIIPGSETASFYYWTGSPFKKNLTAHNHERRILTIGMEEPEDYESLPILHNGYSTRYTGMAIPEIMLYFVILALSVLLIRWKGFYRIAGVIIAVWSIAAIVNSNMFRSSPFDQYHGDQGIAPYQLVIDHVNSRGGLTFWNYPETRSGIRKLGPVFVNTPPYPGVLLESEGYTGFAALYGDTITITEPGDIWDKALIEYCRGMRERPVWGIATADFHKEGESGEVLGNFQTVFLVNKKSRDDVLKAIKNGKMYAYRGRYPQFVSLDEFSVSSSNGKAKGISGDEVILKDFPRIKIALSSVEGSKNPVMVRLIRSGMVIQVFQGKLPMQIDYEDRSVNPGEKVYYRMDMKGEGRLVSNPIFVKLDG